jgi:small-conductance mechanosensitive channel
MSRVVLAVLGLLLATGALAQDAPAPPPMPPAAATTAPELAETAQVRDLSERLERAEAAINASKERDDDLARLRRDVEAILNESADLAEQLRPKLAEVRGLIAKLGPVPAAGAPPEAPQIAAERAKQNNLASAIDGAIKSTELTWVKARQLIERITDLRHDLFTQSLFQEMPSPLTPAFWRKVSAELPAVTQRLSYIVMSWWQLAGPHSVAIMTLLGIAFLLYLALEYVFYFVTAYRRGRREVRPNFFERVASVTWIAPLHAVAPIFAALLVYVGLDSMGVLQFWADRILWAGFKAVLIFATIAAVISAVLAPREPDWRLVPVSTRGARSISGFLQGITAVYAADIALAEINRWLFIPLALSIAQTMVANLLVAGLLVLLMLTPFAVRDADGRRVPRSHPRWLKYPIWIVTISIIAATLLGYISLGRFIAQQFVLTGVVVVVSGLLYLAIRAFTRDPAELGLPVVGEILEQRFGLDAPRRQALGRLTELALTLSLVALAVPFILLQWGFSGADIRDWAKQIFFGFEIGQIRISLARILLGIVLFIGLVLATRLFQRWLRDTMLEPGHMDSGIANSILQVAGYAGTVLAALLAISYAGFDITNLAIVAGALSVGIGFGLQSIVNNFVSGLILLIERPIKVGDWIVVGADEGYVRRISVRSTEIETFDRSSVIVPNAELISGRVKNWTLHDPVGRVKIVLEVRHDANPEVASQIMLKAASEHPGVLRFPAPFISFETFALEQCQLALSVFVNDVNKGGSVKSQLSFAILRALQQAGIAHQAAGAAATAPGSIPFRFTIGIGHGSDPHRAYDIIRNVVARHDGLSRNPEPVVEFDSFGTDGVILAVSGVVVEAPEAPVVKTGLAFAIRRALNDAGIEHATPEHQVKLTDLEPVRQAFLAAMAERRKQQQTEPSG